MTLDTIDFGVVRDLVHGRVGIGLTADNEHLVEMRLAPIARELGLASVSALIQRLREAAWSPLHARVVEAMTTNETSFFRDWHPFEALRKQILPELIERRAQERQLNFWSAACSSGQEPYSIAMLLREHFRGLSSWELTFWATDYSAEMVERTRAGRFNRHEIARGLPTELRDRYFSEVGGDWQATRELRSMLSLRALNLTEKFPPLPKFDVVFLRNVLIYFDTPTKRSVLARIREQLKPGGFLMLGATEMMLNPDDGFEPVRIEQTSCFRAGASAASKEEGRSPAREICAAAASAPSSSGRVSRRFVAPSFVRFRAPGGEGRCVLIDISATGARLDWPHPKLAVGERIALAIDLLPSEPSPEVQADVVRLTPVGVAVRFIEGEGLARLRRDLATRLEKSPDAAPTGR